MSVPHRPSHADVMARLEQMEPTEKEAVFLLYALIANAHTEVWRALDQLEQYRKIRPV